MPALMINQNNPATDTTSLESPNQTDPTLFVSNTSAAGYDGDDRLQPDAIVTQTFSGIGCNAIADQNAAIQGTSLGFHGVIGRSRQNSGVLGQTGALGGFSGPADPAVMGVASGNTGDGVSGVALGNGNGVSGVANGPGALGVAGSGTFGVGGFTSGNNMAGVFGSASADSPGVWGQTSSGSWPAVEGFNRGNNNGVRGVSLGTAPPGGGANVGVVGFSTSGSGVVGIASTPSGVAFGGLFFGGLLVASGPKSAAVKHRDGSHRLFYSVESPESWFEDFGRTKLVRGKAEVKLDPNFAGFVRTDDYHVFLSPEGQTKGLYVSRRSRKGFTVREQEEGASTTTFSYRIVARRKDLKIQRFKPVRLPVFQKSDFLRTPDAAPKLKPPTVPDLKNLPKEPMVYRRSKP
jgi:hypothetical protein